MQKFGLSILAFLLCVGAAHAQQYQSQVAPLYAANSKYINGTSAGYAPTYAATGLTLTLSTGRVNCNTTMTNYAGGTLTMANGTTNYVYLNPGASCAPTSNTTGYTGATIPIATVVTSGGNITSVTDDRTLGFATGSFSADDPDVKIIPAANCVSGAAGGGWNYATSTFTAACRAGSNNLGGALQAIPNTGAAAQFMIELPQDWDTGTQPYINVYYGSGANASGTVIWTVSSACADVSTPGGASDDPSFHAESAFATQTMANANRMWYIGGQFTAVTSGNGCKALSPVIIKVVVSGTAASAINTYQAVLTIPRIPKVQAN